MNSVPHIALAVALPGARHFGYDEGKWACLVVRDRHHRVYGYGATPTEAYKAATDYIKPAAAALPDTAEQATLRSERSCR